MNQYCYSTTQVADKLNLSGKTVRKIAGRLGLGIDVGGRVGFRYCEDDVARILDSMRVGPRTPEPVTRKKRRRRAVAISS